MTDTLRIKRRASGAPGAPSSLASAELAYNEVDHTLYYGEGNSGGNAVTIAAIAGQGLSSAATPQALTAAGSAGTATQWARGDHAHPATAPTAANGNNTTSVATTAFVLATNINQLAAPTTDVSWASHKITNLIDPTNPQDVATKNYCDTVAQGLDAKQSVKAATTGANITLSGTQTIDGVALVANDRCLVKDQTAQSANGIYVVAAGSWTRALDMDVWAEVPDAFCFVEQGTANADTGWVCTSDQGGTLGTTSITWTQFSSAGTVTAGNGLNKVGSTLNVVGTAGQIAVAAAVSIDPTYVGQTSITTLGTIATGTWNATTIGVARGGTGATTLTGYIQGNGTSAFTASATIPNTAISGLGTMSTQNATAVAITGGTIDGIIFDGGTF